MQGVWLREEGDMKRFKAVVGLEYPDEKSQAVIKSAGGMSKLTEAQRAKLKTKKVKAGGFCDDVPPSSLKVLLKQGSVVEVGASKEEDEMAWSSPKPKRPATRKK